MIDNIHFNKRIKYNDIETGSLVWVNFGETKHLFLKEMERQIKEDCFITPLKNKHKLINLHTAPLDV